MFKPTVQIDLNSIKLNYEQLKEFSGSKPLMVMVKANAYGHGSIEVARKLSSADYFGVSRLHEAVELREAGITNEIVLMEGFFDKEELEYCIFYRLGIVIHQTWQLKLVINSIKKPYDIWVKINTGMNRLGFNPKEVFLVSKELIKAGIHSIKYITHFSHADDVASSVTENQVQCFNNSLTKIDSTLFCSSVSLANSAALINHPVTNCGIIRVGISVYGINVGMESLPLKPAMSFISKVIAINECKANSLVGYSGKWSPNRDTNLAVVAVGYGDGYPRHAKNGTPVVIKNKKYSIVGTISMDMILVDIGNDDINIGDLVELWGGQNCITEVATFSDTICYELMCGLTNRVKKVYL